MVTQQIAEVRVAAQDLALKGAMDNADGGLFERRAKTLFALAQLDLACLFLGDVFDHAAHSNGLPVGIELELAPAVNPADLLVGGTNDAILPIERIMAGENIVKEIAAHGVALVGMNERGPSFRSAIEFLADAEDLIHLLRTCPSDSGDIEDIAPQIANRLGLAQRFKAFMELNLCFLAPGDVFKETVEERFRLIGFPFPAHAQRDPDKGPVLSPELGFKPANSPGLRKFM